MNITLTFHTEDAHTIADESPLFRSALIEQLFKDQTTLQCSKNDVVVRDSLVQLVRKYRNDQLLEAVKFVRQWAVDNKDTITGKTYEEWYGLKGAKDFVLSCWNKKT